MLGCILYARIECVLLSSWSVQLFNILGYSGERLGPVPIMEVLQLTAEAARLLGCPDDPKCFGDATTIVAVRFPAFQDKLRVEMCASTSLDFAAHRAGAASSTSSWNCYILSTIPVDICSAFPLFALDRNALLSASLIPASRNILALLKLGDVYMFLCLGDLPRISWGLKYKVFGSVEGCCQIYFRNSQT